MEGRAVVIEHRRGGPDQHFSATTSDRQLAQRILWNWATQTPGWEKCLSWQRVEIGADTSAALRDDRLPANVDDSPVKKGHARGGKKMKRSVRQIPPHSHETPCETAGQRRPDMSPKTGTYRRLSILVSNVAFSCRTSSQCRI